MDWKWTKGEPHERSRRWKHQQQIESQEFAREMEASAFTTSLHHDENTWDMMNTPGLVVGGQTQQVGMGTSGFKVSSKREDLDRKFAGRELTQQIGFNPFLGQTNYVDDIGIRDQFLKPQNTTQGDRNGA